MDRKELLKKMLPGFLPLFVFIIADEIWGTKVGLIVALVFGVVELGYTWIKDKRIDRFVLFDLALLFVLGGISLAFDNDIFFKLKPGFIGLILCAVLAFSAFSKHNLMMAMSKRYMKDIPVTDAMEIQMHRSMVIMFWIFCAHTILVFYSAFYLSKEAWVFISGGLFYILFGVVFLYEFVRQRFGSWFKYRNEEWLTLVDEEGRITGKAPRSVVHNGSKLLHPVVHLHVFDPKKQIYLQLRPLNKLVQPGKWDTAVGGHIAAGEPLELALERETREEIGLENIKPQLAKVYKWESAIEMEMVYMFVVITDKSPVINKQEVDDGRFWSTKEIEKNLGKDIFTPSFEHEYRMLKSLIR